ncbi:CPBP family intramembrane glutamic endopeptidase [Cerasicoccus frondis]|uniref:CPBP family intramembrane glutamic endopeptidase n=1 Tax=Cerasicoccus frondis TaxID=490090 RepID=UPI0028528C18|nr:CPBP family intramembrane glutamic endopeptidase [Cerasicoccus frondis]
MESLITPYLIFLFLAGIACLIKEVRDLGTYRQPPLLAWNITFIKFLELLALAIALYFMSSLIAAEATKDWANNPALDPWRVTAIGYAAHGSILLLMALLFYRPLREWNEIKLVETPLTLIVNQLPFHQALLRAVIMFLAAFPIIGLASTGWEQVLILLNEHGFNFSLERQAQVDLFTSSETSFATLSLIALAVIVAPISEELLFRGFIYRYLKGRMPMVVAMVVSAGIFSLIHFNWLAAAPLFLLGMILCWAYEKNANILVPICLHAVFNANTIMIIFLAPDLDAIS